MKERQRKKEEKVSREKEAQQRATASGKTRGKKAPNRPSAQYARSRTYASSGSGAAGADGQPKRTSSKINYQKMNELFQSQDSDVAGGMAVGAPAIPMPFAGGVDAPVPVSAVAVGGAPDLKKPAARSSKAQGAEQQPGAAAGVDEEEEELEEVVENAEDDGKAGEGETYEAVEDADDYDEEEEDFYDEEEDYH